MEWLRAPKKADENATNQIQIILCQIPFERVQRQRAISKCNNKWVVNKAVPHGCNVRSLKNVLDESTSVGWGSASSLEILDADLSEKVTG